MKVNFNLIKILLLYGIALYISVGYYGVEETSDARYAEISREMFNSGDILHPELLNVHHYHKPFMTYAISEMGYYFFGVNAFGARFFLQIAVLLQILLVYFIARLLLKNEKTALWSAIIYMSFPIVLISSRNLTTDAYLTTFVLWSIYNWIKYRKDGVLLYLYLFAFSLSLGFLTKGPVVLIVPLVFTLLYNRVEVAKRSLSIHHILSLFVFVGISLSYFMYLSLENSQFIDYFLGRQTVDRFSKDVFGRTEPFYYFLVFFPLISLPWFVPLVVMIKDQIKQFTKKSLFFVLSITVAIALVFFSISSSKRILYILPFFGLLAILTAQLLNKTSVDKSKTIYVIIFAFNLIILTSLIISSFIDIDFEFPYRVTILDAIALHLVIFISIFKQYDYKLKSIGMTILFSMNLLISSGYILSANEFKVNSTKNITDFIIDKELNHRDILVYDQFKPSIAFNLNKNIISIYYKNHKLIRETQFEEDDTWKNFYININKQEGKDRALKISKEPTVLIVYKDKVNINNQLWLVKNYQHKKNFENWTVYY